MTGPDSRYAGWVRLAVVVLLLVGIVAVVAWKKQPAADTAPPVAAGKSQPPEKTRKPAPASSADPRDTARDRPDRERTPR